MEQDTKTVSLVLINNSFNSLASTIRNINMLSINIIKMNHVHCINRNS